MNAIYTGRRRSGKTTLAFSMARESGGGIVVFDPKREFRGWPGTVSSIENLERAARKKQTVIIYHPDGDTNEAFVPVAEWIIRQHVLAMQRGWDSKGFHFTLLCDEAHNLMSPNWTNPELLQILSQNRPEILNVYLTFQSPKDAYNRIKSRVSDWYIFSTNLPSDLDYLEKEIGISAEDAARITTLGDHEYVHFYFDGGQPVAEFVTDADSWYVNLNYVKEEEKNMAEERNEPKKPQFPLQLDNERDVYDAYDMVNRRKKDDPNSKHRGRKSDREQSGDGGTRDGKKKVFKIGDWQKTG